MTNWLTTREAVKAALSQAGTDQNAIIDRHIAAASAEVEAKLRRWFIPRLMTRYYPWPQYPAGASYRLALDQDLLSVSSLTSQGGTVVIDPSDYYLEPANSPPYRWIEIVLGSSASFGGGDSSQRAIAVTGLWGWWDVTVGAGALAAAIDGDDTVLSVTNGALIGVGDTLLIGNEMLFVTEIAPLDTTLNLAAGIAADPADVAVSLSGTGVNAGEVIQIDSERLYVNSVTGTTAHCRRAYDASPLAAHLTGADVYAYRSATVERGVNGSVAASHLQAAAIERYAPPEDIDRLTRAVAIFSYKQDQSGQTGVVGQGDALMRVTSGPMSDLWERARAAYRVPVVA